MDEWFPKAESQPITVRRAFMEMPKLDLTTAVEWGTNPNWIVTKYIPLIKQGKSCDDVHPKRAGYNLIRLHESKPSPTIPKTCNGSLFAGLLPPHGNRYCAIGELKRLGSFPDHFNLMGDFEAQWARIGNSVPPLFMRSIARNIKSMLQAKQPYRQIAKSATVDYPAILEEAWREHLAQREPDAPTVISLFAGCGGSSLGYSMAGYRELLAVEWDDNAVATFKLNFPDVPVYHGDIAKLSVDECLQMTGLQPGQLDVLDGSPPCQGFSTAGKRVMDDPRNQLFREYVRLLRGLQPKVFVMENVSGMVKGKMKLVFVEILKELKASGYKVSARLLNAMYFNVPQSRQRMIFIGVREDLQLMPSHPKAGTRPLSVNEAIGESNVVLEAPAWRKFNYDLWSKQKPGDNGFRGKYFNHVRMDFRKPSPTIPKSAVFGGFVGLSHCTSPRSLHLGELMRISSYPDGFQFVGSYEDGLNRIGNSVPPLFMRAIAEHIKTALITKITNE